MRIPHNEHSAPYLGMAWGADAAAYYRLAVPLAAAGASAIAPFYAARMSQVHNAETIVIARYGGARDARPADVAATVRALRQDSGARVIVDFDDDVFGQPARYRSPSANLPATEAAARAADGLTCTSDYLAGRLRRLHRDVRVVPNYVRPQDWPDPGPQPDGPVVLVLAGSYTHEDDWRIVAPALRRLHDAHGDGIRLRVCGYIPDYLKPLCNDWRPWKDLDHYPAMLAGAHIGLCPLPDSGFNRCKSPIKLYEYALSGLAVVASPTQYGPVLRAAGQGAHIVPDGADWYAVLDHLIRHAAERQAAADGLRRHVIEHHDARRHAATIRAAYAA